MQPTSTPRTSSSWNSLAALSSMSFAETKSQEKMMNEWRLILSNVWRDFTAMHISIKSDSVEVIKAMLYDSVMKRMKTLIVIILASSKNKRHRCYFSRNNLFW